MKQTSPWNLIRGLERAQDNKAVSSNCAKRGGTVSSNSSFISALGYSFTQHAGLANRVRWLFPYDDLVALSIL